MAPTNVILQISKKGSDKEKIARRVIKNPDLVPELLDGLNADRARVKYGCEKVLRIIGEKKPEVLYPHFNLFVKLLDSDNNFLKWGAIITISNLARVDSKKKFEKISAKYFSPINGPVMITAANVIGNAGKIALAKPALTERITREILKVEKAKYRTAECRNVALGHAINSFDRFFDRIKDKEPVLALVRKQRRNRRNAVRKKAEKFMKKHDTETTRG